MERCNKCKNCENHESCDKFNFYDEYAFKKKIIDKDIMLDFSIDPIQKPKSFKEDKDVVAFTIREEYLIVEYIKTHYSQYNNMFLLALYTRNENW